MSSKMNMGRRTRFGKGNRKAYERRPLLEALEDRRLLTALGTMAYTYDGVAPALTANLRVGSTTHPDAPVGVLNLTRTTGGSYLGTPTEGQSFDTFCLEVLSPVASPTGLSSVVGLDQAPRPGDLGSGPMSVVQADYLRELWGRYYGSIGSDATLSNRIAAAAFQFAVWEIVHDTSWDLSGGTFMVLPNDPVNLKVTSAVTQATAWLGTLNGSGPKATLLALTDPPSTDPRRVKQDLIFEVPPASLGDRVWLDANADGIQDVGEVGISGVTVDLYTSDDILAGTTSTDGSGNYSFVNLTPGDYYVKFTAPAGYELSSQDQGGDDTADSDADGAGKTIVTTLISGENDITWDAGMYQLASLGDFVWEDLNGDGIQDVGEPGIAKVSVTLSGAGLDGIFGTSDDTSGTQVSDSNGQYKFTGLMPGQYQVQFAAPGGYVFTATNVGSDLSDSDADGAGLTGVYTLVSNESNLTVDAGLYRPASLGDFVWEDLNGDGQQDVGEPGMAGVAVTLTGAGLDGFFGTSDDTTATQNTSGGGAYLFTGLTPGSYQVTFDSISGYNRTVADTGGDATDSDANAITGVTGVYTLVSGDTNLTVDAGYYRLASLSGYVYKDCNYNGIFDNTESGLAGVTVKLSGLDNLGNAVSQTTTTAIGGSYSFAGLRPGTYSVTEVQPSAYLDGAESVGTLGGNATVNDVFSKVPVLSGDAGAQYNFGEVTPSKLSGYVYDDLNDNGLFEPGSLESGIAGVTIKLIGTTNAGGSVSLTTTTDANGAYSFGDLYPGNYSINETQPGSYTDGKDTLGTAGGTVFNDKFVIGLQHCGTDGQQYNFGELGLLHGLTGTIGWWANSNGQMMIKLLGASSTAKAGTSAALGNWLASNFPKMYGATAGANNFTGKTTAYIASRFLVLKGASGQKLDAQTLGLALSLYTTTSTLNNTTVGRDFATKHGFVITLSTNPKNLKNVLWNVGGNGEAFGVADNTKQTVWTLLQKANTYAVNGALFASGRTIGGVYYSSTDLRNQANVVFSAINQAGDIWS